MNWLTKKTDRWTREGKLEYGMDSLFLWYCNIVFIVIIFIVYIYMCVLWYTTNIIRIFASFVVVTKPCIGWEDKESGFLRLNEIIFTLSQSWQSGRKKPKAASVSRIFRELSLFHCLVIFFFIECALKWSAYPVIRWIWGLRNQNKFANIVWYKVLLHRAE